MEEMPSDTCHVHGDTSASSTLSLLLHSPTLRGDLPLLCWVVAAEERSERHSCCLREGQERGDLTSCFYRSLVQHLLMGSSSGQTPRSSTSASSPQASIKEGDREGPAAVKRHGATQQRTKHISSLERLAAAALECEECGSAALDSTDAVVSPSPRRTVSDEIFIGETAMESFSQRLDEVERTLATLPSMSYPRTPPCATTTPSAAAKTDSYTNDKSEVAASTRVSLDACLCLLDVLVSPRTSLAELARAPRTAHPYNEAGAPFLFDASRQRHVLAILSRLRNALRSVQDAYMCAAHDYTSSPTSLDTLLQLPPDTLPLLMSTNGKGKLPAWCTLFASVSLFTLWSALVDSLALFDDLRRPVVDALWAAVLWMHAYAPPQQPQPGLAASNLEVEPAGYKAATSVVQHTPIQQGLSPRVLSASPLATPRRNPHRSCVARASAVIPTPRTKRGGAALTCQAAFTFASPTRRREPLHHLSRCESSTEERWAYRDFPVQSAQTAPTVYDELFPLPSAVSAFTAPGKPSTAKGAEPRSVPRPLVADQGSALLPEKEDAAWMQHYGLDFYTGPARRPQSLS